MNEQEIARSLRAQFPEPYRIGLMCAIVKTFAMPTISSVLDTAGGFYNADTRLERTSYTIYSLFDHGHHSKEGLAAIERMNHAHDRADITNDKLLYVLSLFVNEPLDVIDRVGHRETSVLEKLATHAFWKEVGTRMRIQDIPDYPGLREYREVYEDKHLTYTPTNERIAEEVLHALHPGDGLLPRLKREFTKATSTALLSARHRAALGYPRWYGLLKPLVEARLRHVHRTHTTY